MAYSGRHWAVFSPSCVAEVQPTPVNTAGDIAIIGLAGRFPGAATVEELWAVLREGRETIRFFTAEELDASIPDQLKNRPALRAGAGRY
jgi:acyl transferase domain-containing protein